MNEAREMSPLTDAVRQREPQTLFNHTQHGVFMGFWGRRKVRTMTAKEYEEYRKENYIECRWCGKSSHICCKIEGNYCFDCCPCRDDDP